MRAYGFLFGLVALVVLPFPASAQVETPPQDLKRNAVSQSVPPRWIRKPTGEELAANFPYDAARKGVGGRAVLHCVIDERGLIEKCSVAEESPAGLGFGASALSMTRFFAFKPGLKDGKAVRSGISIPINFVWQRGMRGSSIMADPIGAPVTMRTDVFWQSAPSWEAFVAANPTANSQAPVRGHVGLRCRLDKQGLLRGCEAVNPSPQGRGFDKAALKLSKSFVVLDDAEYRKKIADDHVSLAFDFPDPANTNAPRTLEKPAWTTLPDPDVVTSLFPEKAAGAGLKIGRATVECVVLPGGALDQCKVIDETPASMGFGESALVVAKVMRVNPWTQQGEPAAGAKVRAPLVFKLSDDPTK